MNIKELYKDKKYTSTIDVALFIILIFSFHFIYLGWQALDFFPIAGLIAKLFDEASTLLFNQSCWVLEHIFNVDIVTHNHAIGVINKNDTYSFINVAPECTSLKQWLHWLFLMLIFPGPWKHKLWYIPLGLVIIEFINVVRVVGITLCMIPFPNHFDFFHDYFFKVLFYFFIFIMWVIWVEKFLHKKEKN
ncbi:MAG: hypothetical protein E7068_00425 [Lentimicrobiaceae bacterium]|nr:hypothetical protein [Lentimicrobiaceae bacterium]MBQ4548430.1 hypothetical protein [Bacteroidales bacterium]